MILTMQNAISDHSGVVHRIAGQTAARRGSDYASEVRRLLDAGLDVMRERGTASRPRDSFPRLNVFARPTRQDG